MKIILHNPSHNGDQLLTLSIVKILINDNLDKEFMIVPACTTYLFTELSSEKVIIQEHPVIWHHNNKNIFNNKNFISENHNTLWNFHDGNIYINLWKLLIQDNYNCISLTSRPTFIKNMLTQINNQTGIKINFNCDNYKELIPILPYMDIEYIREKITSYNKKIIFFYNQNSFCGIENSYPNDINEKTIQQLINNYGEHYMIILSKPCNITHKNLINVETEFDNLPSFDGKNLIINANIANLCDEVYFKNNGGSLFILNQMNIANKNVKYNFIGNSSWQNIYYNEYELNSTLIPI
jgi:hypothetical protein